MNKEKQEYIDKVRAELLIYLRENVNIDDVEHSLEVAKDVFLHDKLYKQEQIIQDIKKAVDDRYNYYQEKSNPDDEDSMNKYYSQFLVFKKLKLKLKSIMEAK